MMMRTLRINLLLKDKILVSRESARLLEPALKEMMDCAGTTDDAPALSPVVDFEGIEGVAPSFLDELILIFESLLGAETNGGERSLIVAHPPTRLSSKFEAVARGHGMSVHARPDGTWLLTDSRRLSG